MSLYCDKFIYKVLEKSKIGKYISEKDSCPKCGKDFAIDEKKRMFYCFHCGNGGNLATFIMQKENKNFIKVIEELAEKENVVLQECIYKDKKFDLDRCEKCKIYDD